MQSEEQVLLAGDIGGTKTHLVVLVGDKQVFEKRYFNSDFDSFEDLLADFKTLSKKEKFSIVGLALAGPIINQQFIKITNLPWIIRARKVQEICQADQLFLLNDLQAAAYCVAGSKMGEKMPRSLGIYSAGQEGPGKNFVVLGLGTGLGLARGVYDEQSAHYSVFPSEAGHARHSPGTDFGRDMAVYLASAENRIDRESYCSSIGLNNIYNYYSHAFPDVENTNHKEEMESADDPSRLILQHASSNCEYCMYLVKQMVLMLVEIIEDIYLQYLPHGGIYLFGGMVDYLIKYLQQLLPDSLNFGEKMAPLSQFISIHAILNPNAVLDGCISYISKLSCE